jgi:hypothetical protein
LYPASAPHLAELADVAEVRAEVSRHSIVIADLLAGRTGRGAA